MKKCIIAILLLSLIGCSPREYGRVKVNVSGVMFERDASSKRCRNIPWKATNTTSKPLIIQGMSQPGMSTSNPIVVSWAKTLNPNSSITFGQVCSHGENSIRIMNSSNAIVGVFTKHRHNEFGNQY